MRSVFMGTPAFALPSLDALHESGHELVAVVTRPDRPRGRNLEVEAPPVKKRALELSLPVWQPVTISDEGVRERMKALNPEMIVVVAYGAFLPRELWSLPPRGTINLHPSLLPKYRGAAPVQHAILNGDTETGVTICYVGEGMDAGDIVCRERVKILPDDTAGSLGNRLAVAGALLLCKVVEAIQEGSAVRFPQEEDEATFAPKLRKSDGRIDWNLPARDIERRIRAMDPWPGAFTFMTGAEKRVRLKVVTARVAKSGIGEPGHIVNASSEGITVGTGSGCLVIEFLQPEGKRPMSTAEFLRGVRDMERVELE